MAKRANYGFEKRQREIRKKKKKAEKAERKREEAAGPAEGPGEDGQGVGPIESGRVDRD